MLVLYMGRCTVVQYSISKIKNSPSSFCRLAGGGVGEGWSSTSITTAVHTLDCRPHSMVTVDPTVTSPDLMAFLEMS